MRKIFVLIGLLLFTLSMSAEVVLMKSGKRYTGEIVFQNDEVVIIRDATGTRFQCPMAEVRSIGAQEIEETPMLTNIANSEVQIPTRKVSLSIEAAGGAATLPKTGWGGYVTADFLIGTRRVMSKNILLGGAVGYTGVFLADKTFSFIPIQVVARIPIIDAQHAPQVNFSAGYGIATSKNYKGGLHAAIDICYRYQMTAKSAVLLGANVFFQQTSLSVIESYPQGQYENPTAGRCLVGIGAKFAIVF